MDCRALLACGCPTDCTQAARLGDLPRVGRQEWCPAHGETTVAAVEPPQWIEAELDLSPGRRLVLVWDAVTSKWGYWCEAPGEDVILAEAFGFATLGEALNHGLDAFLQQ
jgi:hypothetical protein